MKINLDYGVRYDPSVKETDKTTAQELTYDYISHAVNSVYKDGLDGQSRRIWGRIQRKFESSIDEKKDGVELENAEKDFIRNAFNKAKYPPQTAKFVSVLEGEIEKFS